MLIKFKFEIPLSFLVVAVVVVSRFLLRYVEIHFANYYGKVWF